MNHRGLRWNVHYVANVGLRKLLNLYKRGFKIYDLLVFYRCRVERRRPPLGRIHLAVLKIGVNHATCYLYSPKLDETYIHGQCYGYVKLFSFHFIDRAAMGVFTRQTLLKHKYEDNVKGLVFFFLWNIYFPLVLALDSMGIMNKLKRWYVAMECADLVAFTFATRQIRSCLLYEFI